jgi:hypothetical protein
VVPNFRSADVSVLLGNGYGSFQPVRRFDGAINPDEMVAGKFITGDNNPDLIVLQNITQVGTSAFAFLRGRGDGTFAPPVFYPTVFAQGATSMVVGDFTGDGNLDVIVFSHNEPLGQLFIGNGDGTFRNGGIFDTGENTVNAVAVDLNGDGKLDLVTTGENSGDVYVILNDGHGGFEAPQVYQARAPRPGENVTVNGLAVVDFGSLPSAGSSIPGPPDGIPDIIVTAASRNGQGAPELIMLPGLTDAQGNYAGFGAPVVLATLSSAGQIATGDFTGDGTTDIAVADKGGVTVVYGKPLTLTANTTPQTARDLGSVTHLVTLPQAVVTGHEDAYYSYTVPTEAAQGAGNEVIDFSALFQDVGGAGLQMQVTDLVGNVLGSGARFQLQLAQGQQLLVHIFGLTAAGGLAQGVGVYTLDIDVLPQLVSVEAPALLPGQNGAPGAPSNSLVLTFQGDRLDPAAAEDPNNYRVTWLGPDGLPGTADDKVIAVAATGGGQSIVYAPGANTQVSSGQTFPTSVRQTVTLYFADPLPVGAYQIEVAPAVQAAPFTASETQALPAGGLNGHPVVSLVGGKITAGSTVEVQNLVQPAGAPDLNGIAGGTSFLTQLHGNLGSLLTSMQSAGGDSPAITQAINDQIQASFGPSAGPVSFLVIWLDPVSIDLADSEGGRAVHNLQTNTTTNNLARSFFETGGNIEVMVLAGASGTFSLNIADVQPTARGGAMVFDGGQTESLALTSAIRGGQREFDFTLGQQGGVFTQAALVTQLNTPSGSTLPAAAGGSTETAVTPGTTTAGVGTTVAAGPIETTASSEASNVAGVTNPSFGILTAALVSTVSLQTIALTGLTPTPELGGQAGAGNLQPTTANPRGAQVGAGGDIDREPVLEQVFEQLDMTAAAALAVPGSGLGGIVHSLLGAVRRGHQAGIRQNGAPLQTAPVGTAPVRTTPIRMAPVPAAPAAPMPGDEEVLWLDPVPEVVSPGPAEGIRVPAGDALVEAWLEDRSPASLSALLGLATLTAGVSWSCLGRESEERRHGAAGLRGNVSTGTGER